MTLTCSEGTLRRFDLVPEVDVVPAYSGNGDKAGLDELRRDLLHSEAKVEKLSNKYRKAKAEVWLAVASWCADPVVDPCGCSRD